MFIESSGFKQRKYCSILVAGFLSSYQYAKNVSSLPSKGFLFRPLHPKLKKPGVANADLVKSNCSTSLLKLPHKSEPSKANRFEIPCQHVPLPAEGNLSLFPGREDKVTAIHCSLGFATPSMSVLRQRVALNIASAAR